MRNSIDPLNSRFKIKEQFRRHYSLAGDHQQSLSIVRHTTVSRHKN